MLKDNFFKITATARGESENRHHVVIELNPDHVIYKGHFPGNPVLPGVCMQQIIKEILMDILGKNLFMCKADNMKFLSVIIPGVNKELNVSINIKSSDDKEIKVDTNISDKERIFFKFAASYNVIS